MLLMSETDVTCDPQRSCLAIGSVPATPMQIPEGMLYWDAPPPPPPPKKNKILKTMTTRGIGCKGRMEPSWLELFAFAV
jgi:hypothetical protein